MNTVPCQACGEPLHEKHAVIRLKNSKANRWTEMSLYVCSACITPLAQKCFDRMQEGK